MTHSSDISVVNGSTIPTEAIDSFLIVERDKSANRPAVYASGDLYTFYTTTRESSGDFNFFDFFLPVNGGPPPHFHPKEDEIWYITDGIIRFNLGNSGEKSLALPKGTTIFGPINRIHGYRNDDSTTLFSDIPQVPGARTLSLTTPGSLDLFFDAAAIRVADRNDPPPAFSGPTTADFLNLGKFNDRTKAGIVLGAAKPDYIPPIGTLPYILVLPPDASQTVVDAAKELMSDPNFKVWTTGTQAGIEQRPTFVGQFGITYTSLVGFTETQDRFSYNQFSLAANTNNLAREVSQNNNIFYVKSDEDPNTNRELTIFIGSEERKIGENTYVYIAPGNRFSIANQTNLPVEALAITVTAVPNPQINLFPSPLIPQSGSSPSKIIRLGDSSDYFNQSDHLPNTYRSLFDTAPGYTDYYPNPITINGINYDGRFETATINPSTGRLVQDEGVFTILNGSFADLSSRVFEQPITIEILRDDYRAITAELGKSEREGVIPQIFLETLQLPNTIPDLLETLPADIFNGISNLSKRNPLPQNAYTPLPFDDPNRFSNPYDFLVIPAFEFAFDVFRDKPKDQGGVPIPIIGGDRDRDGFGWTVEGFESRRLIYAGGGSDEIYAIKDDAVYGDNGDDILDASQGKGGNRLYGGVGDDRLLVNFNDRAFGQNGNDLLDASQGIGLEGLDDKGRSLLDGGSGNDILIAGSNGELIGGTGNDQIYIRGGGDNLLYGGAGRDQFWILSGVFPETVQIEYSDFAKSLLPPFLSFPELRDTKNTIMDFQLGLEKIYIDTVGTTIIAESFADLQLLPTFGDLNSTSIIAKFMENGISKEVSLVNVKGIIFNEFTASDFVFMYNLS
ncbi:MAG: cupin domain-containing protein [Pseudanabaenaceae cyanobacterium bins.68]|nr:cupin domain-containing protein [Pseudanabaenaceae cyanobacterium bins.68]